jgi:hypothetical protein
MCLGGQLNNFFILGLWYGLKFTLAHLSSYLTPLQVIATRTFLVLFLRIPAKQYTVWIVLIGNWSLLFAIILAGPATAMIQKHGPYCEHPQYESPFLTEFDSDLQMASQTTGVGSLQIIQSNASRAYRKP